MIGGELELLDVLAMHIDFYKGDRFQDWSIPKGRLRRPVVRNGAMTSAIPDYLLSAKKRGQVSLTVSSASSPLGPITRVLVRNFRNNKAVASILFEEGTTSVVARPWWIEESNLTLGTGIALGSRILAFRPVAPSVQTHRLANARIKP